MTEGKRAPIRIGSSSTARYEYRPIRHEVDQGIAMVMLNGPDSLNRFVRE
jgi:hypothetical protein